MIESSPSILLYISGLVWFGISCCFIPLCHTFGTGPSSLKHLSFTHMSNDRALSFYPLIHLWFGLVWSFLLFHSSFFLFFFFLSFLSFLLSGRSLLFLLPLIQVGNRWVHVISHVPLAGRLAWQNIWCNLWHDTGTDTSHLRDNQKYMDIFKD